MLFKQSTILLFACILSFSVAEDVESYDVNTLRKMLSSQEICPLAYSRYISNCTINYKHYVNGCETAMAESKRKLENDYIKNQQQLTEDAGDSCQNVIECQKDFGSNFNECVAQQTSKTSATLNTMHYNANRQLSDYNNKTRNIETTCSDCINIYTWLTSIQNKAAVHELDHCFETGEWDLIELIFDVPEPAEAPVDQEK